MIFRTCREDNAPQLPMTTIVHSQEKFHFRQPVRRLPLAKKQVRAG
jgi:hypothetical protein